MTCRPMRLDITSRSGSKGKATVFTEFVPDIQFAVITEQASTRKPGDVVIAVEAVGIADPAILIIGGVFDPGEHAFTKMQNCDPAGIVSSAGAQSVGLWLVCNGAPLASRLFNCIGRDGALTPAAGK